MKFLYKHLSIRFPSSKCKEANQNGAWERENWARWSSINKRLLDPLLVFDDVGEADLYLMYNTLNTTSLNSQYSVTVSQSFVLVCIQWHHSSAVLWRRKRRDQFQLQIHRLWVRGHSDPVSWGLPSPGNQMGNESKPKTANTTKLFWLLHVNIAVGCIHISSNCKFYSMSIEFAKLPWIMQKIYLTSQFPVMQYTKLKTIF